MEKELEELSKTSKQLGYVTALNDVMQVIKTARNIWYINPVIIEHITEEIAELEKDVKLL